MSKYLSDKIRVLSFVAIIFVVFLHGQLFEYSKGENLLLQRLISGEITRVAVPLFFSISGFLLFYSCEQFDLSWYCKKIRSRVRTLAIPFLAWSLYGFFIVYTVKSIIPSMFSSVKPFAGCSVNDYLLALLWQPVGTYQLWFIRDLIVCVIISPIIYYGLKFLKYYYLAVLGLFWILSIQWVISIESILFVSLGSYVALYHKNEVERFCTSKVKIVVYAVICICACFIDIFFPIGYLVRSIVIISGILFLWSFYDIVYGNVFYKMKDYGIARYTFFIYVFHEPLLTFVKGFFFKIADGQWVVFLSYIASPIITIIVCFITGYIFKKSMPNFYSIICGGR